MRHSTTWVIVFLIAAAIFSTLPMEGLGTSEWHLTHTAPLIASGACLVGALIALLIRIGTDGGRARHHP